MSRFFSNIELTTWMLVSTPVFLFIFLLINYFIFSPKNKQRWEQLGDLPLDKKQD